MTLLTAPTLAKHYTAEDLLRLPDRNGFELVDGQLRERAVSKESSRVGLTVGRLLGNEAARTGEAEVYGADLGYRCFPPGSDKEIRKADASVIRREKLLAIKGDPGYMPVPADLVVEVISPNDLIRDVNDKVEEYLTAGFGIVWIIDPVKKTVMIQRQDGSVTKLHENDQITGESALPGFRCRVAELLK
jgi:Uma2 family endonuclease